MKFGLSSLHLRHFRSFEKLHLKGLQGINTLIAQNGFGKTNILEAISLFTPGKGLRGADTQTLQNHHHPHPFQVGCDFFEDRESIHFGTTYTHTETGRAKRIFKKEGVPLKSQNEIHQLFSVNWITPSMDRMVSEEGAIQRAFIDRLTFAFFPDHALHRTAYDKLIRERNIILKEHGPITHALWLDKIEEQIAQKALNIIAERKKLLQKLEQSQGVTPFFPNFSAMMKGDVEDVLEKNAPLDEYIKTLHAKRAEDSRRGASSFGPHRSKLHLLHIKKNMSGEFCSTGEQKMLLLAMILAFVKNDFERGVILLLDDVVDHLDLRHRQSLFEEIVETQQKNKLQIWLTGANEIPFETIKDHGLCLRENDLVTATQE